MSDVAKRSESKLRSWIIWCVVAANVAAYGYAIAASRMLTFYFCTMYGPLLNAALVVAAAVAVVVVKARDRQVSLPHALAVAVGVPVLAAVLFGIAGMLYVRLPQKPNQPSEPTPTAGTSAAEQPRVPAVVVALRS